MRSGPQPVCVTTAECGIIVLCDEIAASFMESSLYAKVFYVI